jgi:hypothetical protein
MVEMLSLLLAPYLLFLLVAIYFLSRPLDGSEGCFHWAENEQSPADEQAEALLRELLSTQHYLQLRELGYLEVVSPSIDQRIYRIPATRDLVKVYEHGRFVMELCLQPVEPLPEGDVVLMHKLMIEANEQEYLQKANHFVRGTIFRHG